MRHVCNYMYAHIRFNWFCYTNETPRGLCANMYSLLHHATMSKFSQRITDQDRERIIVRYDMMLDLITHTDLNDGIIAGTAFYIQAQAVRTDTILGLVQTIRRSGTCRLMVGAPYLYRMISLLRKHMSGVVDDALACETIPSEMISLRADMFISQVVDRGLEPLMRVLQHQCKCPLVYDMMADAISTRQRYDDMMMEMSSDDSL
jgi:hypothetical protein